jgi:ubiquitin thioesterase protein OTUB1
MLDGNVPSPIDNWEEVTNFVTETDAVDTDIPRATSIKININESMDCGHDSNIYNQQSRLMDEIESMIKEQPLTSDRCLLSLLEKQYKSNTNFMSGLTHLQETYSHIRIVRGDGNCYYRAFLYSLLELLVSEKKNNRKFGRQILEYVETKSWNDILAQGYDEMAIEIFHDEMVSIFKNILDDDIPYDRDTFHQQMNEENSVSDYCTWYLRIITATYIKQDPDRFLPFLISYSNQASDCILDINQFCSKFIEPMGQECEHIQVLALAEAFGISVRVEYLDGRTSPESHSNGTANAAGISYHEFGSDDLLPRILLLYRPGHYDILYEKSK